METRDITSDALFSEDKPIEAAGSALQDPQPASVADTEDVQHDERDTPSGWDSILGHELLTREEECELGHRVTEAHQALIGALARTPTPWRICLADMPMQARAQARRLIEGASEPTHDQEHQAALVAIALQDLVAAEDVGEAQQARHSLSAALHGTRLSTRLTHELLAAVHSDTGVDPATLGAITQAQRDWRAAVNELVSANYKLAQSVAHRYQTTHLEEADRFEEAVIGVITAAEKYDPATGWRFGTYAVNWIRHQINRAITNQSRLVRIPIGRSQWLQKQARELEALEAEQARALGDAEAARILGIEVSDLQEMRATPTQAVSMEQPMLTESGDARARTFKDVFPSPDPGPEQINDNASQAMWVWQLIERLDAQERDVLVMRYGLHDDVCSSYANIARATGINTTKVRSLAMRAERRLYTEARLDAAGGDH